MDPSQNPLPPEQISSESYNVSSSSSQIQAPSYVYEPDQSTYAYYPPSYQYTYYDPAQQAAYDYANVYYQQPQQEQPTSTLPPAAPFPPQPQPEQAAAAGQYQYSYYPRPQLQGVEYGGVYGCVAAIPSGTSTAQTLQPSHRGTTKRGGRTFRGGGRGGCGRGRGRGGVQPHIQPSGVTPQQGNSAPVMAWCELCRVECNTPEILEQHKNGKKHKKNMKVQEELQRVMASNSLVKPEVSQEIEGGSKLPSEENSSLEAINGSSEQQPQENLPLQAIGEDNKAEIMGDSGLKRKIRGGGRVGKSMRSNDGRRKLVPPKPKQQAIPLICELCKVTCESQVVFQSHLKGKKHLSNRKRFEESEAANQPLFPAPQAVFAALPGVAPSSDPNFHQHNFPIDLSFLTQPEPQVLASTSALPPIVLQPVDHQDPPNLQESKPVDEAIAQI